MRKRNIVIVDVYRPPECPAEKIINPLSKIITKLIEIGNPMPNIYMGDLNFPTSDWQMETPEGGTHERQVTAIWTGTMLAAAI